MIYSNDPEHGKYLTLHFTGRGSHWNRCDIDIDGAVGLSDLSLLAQQWLQRPDSPSADIAPINKPDEFVDLEDWAALSQAWLMFMD